MRRSFVRPDAASGRRMVRLSPSSKDGCCQPFFTTRAQPFNSSVAGERVLSSFPGSYAKLAGFQTHQWLNSCRLLHYDEVALYPDVIRQTDSVRSAACNYVRMQRTVPEHDPKRAREKRERRRSEEKLLCVIFGSVKSSDSVQQS